MTWLSDRVVRRLQDVAKRSDLEGTRYTAIEEIGRGGMGTVYRARDEALGRDVAVTVISAVDADAALAARLEQEALVLARLEHPGIVPVHDAGTLADGRAFYVMKLVRGASLTEHLAGVERLDERLRIFERICEAVAFAHASGVVHRDLKPANVMVGSFGEVLVLDWGLAMAVNRRVRADTDAGVVLGTPGFMPPEQVRGDAVDHRADVYALGAMLSSMLTDRPPIRLRAICGKAMAASPEDRYPDVALLADDVSRFRAGLPVSAHRETALERLARFVSTYRTPILLVLAYLIMRILVAIYAALNPVVR
jgi:serine/threonine protein kinase